MILDELLAAYRAAPCAELHALIIRASRGLAAPAPADIRGRLKTALATWAERATAPAALEVPALLETLVDAGARTSCVRMKMVNAWPADPRVDAHIAGWLALPPWHGDTAKEFWREVFARVEQIRDPATIEALHAVPIGPLDASMATWVRTARGRALDACTPFRARPPANLAELTAAVDAALVPAAISTDARSEAELLAAIRRDPDDTASRLVYADALIARGDPYGEFIAIQCGDAQDAKRTKRAAALCKKHRAEWLGPLATVISKDCVFERGFLARCEVSPLKRARIPPLVGHPLWSTVRAFVGPDDIALHPSMVALRELVYWSSDSANRARWRELLVDTPRPIVKLTYGPGSYSDLVASAEWAALRECVALPDLRHLAVWCSTSAFRALLRAPVASRLHTIRAEGGGTGFADTRWVSDLIEACEVPVLEVVEQLVLRVERDSGDVTFELSDPRQQVDLAIAMVPRLPATTRRVTIAAPPSVGAAPRAAIAGEVRARFGDIELRDRA